MSIESWLGVALLAVAISVLAFATAAEAGVGAMSRLRVRASVLRGLPKARSLEVYLQERHSLLTTLAVARNAAIVVGIAVGTFLVLRQTGHTWIALVVTMSGAVVMLLALEVVPRLLVARSPEAWGLRLVPVLGALRLVFGVPARQFERIMSALQRSPGKAAETATPEEEELLRLVEMHEGNGADVGELSMIRRVSQMVDTAVREIMVPRIDMVAMEAEEPLKAIANVIIERGFSRIPIYQETVDNIVGIVHAKDILRYFANGVQPPSAREIARPPFFVPEGKRIDELLAEMRQSRMHMAIVVDEYGGTAGLVTIEDVIEEITGEIQDEYDREEPSAQRLSEDEAIVDARLSLDDLNELLGLQLESEEVDTVGGFVYHALGRMPAPGDEIHADGLVMRVISTAGRRIRKVRVTKAKTGAVADSGTTAPPA